MLQGHMYEAQGHIAATVILVWHAHFGKKVRYWDKILFPALVYSWNSHISNHNMTDVKYAATNKKTAMHIREQVHFKYFILKFLLRVSDILQVSYDIIMVLNVQSKLWTTVTWYTHAILMMWKKEFKNEE